MDDDTKQDGVRQDAQRFGDYEVLRDAGGGPLVLGSGSYGRIYKARHVLLKTEVALKVIRRELTASESMRQRFLREGQALSGLAHDHIALLRHFSSSADGQLYFVMDYCGGGTLAERVRLLGARPPGEALEIVRQVASALAAAHAAGIIHRDLKPGNIMLTRTPPPLRVKVIDFGLALSSGTGAAGGRFHGTPEWASPEQLREQAIDGRSDLFSLGLIFWFLLEGAAPDSGGREEVMNLRLAPGGYAERLPQGLPPGIRELLAHLLETEPSRRPDSALRALAYLDALRETYPYEASAAPLAEPVPDAGAGLPVRTGILPYRPLTGLHRDLAGKWFEVRPEAGQGARIEFILDEKRAATPGLWERVQANLERLWRHPVDGLPRFSVIYETNGTWVAEFEGSTGGDLNSWLEREKKIKLADALGFLVRVAVAADAAHACGLPGLGLMAEQVRWESGGGGADGGTLRGAIPRLFPLLLGASDVPEGNVMSDDPHGSTLVLVGPELACNRLFMLARLIYQMVCGRRPPDAVAYSRSAYITVSALSEQGNAIVRDALGLRGPWISCLELLEDLAAAEHLSLKGSGSGSTPVPPQQPTPPAVHVSVVHPATPALTVPPVKRPRQPMGLRATAGWVSLGLTAMGLAGVWLLGGNPKKPTPEPETSAVGSGGSVPSVPLLPSLPSVPLLPSPRKPLLSDKPDSWVGAKAGERREANLGGGVKLELCGIPAGTFTMGGTGLDETPHPVTLTQPFWLGRTEVTQAQWEAVMGTNPSNFTGKELPVETVSWDDTSDFCRKLNAKGLLPAGWHFALPSEAQWEYACRAGTTGEYAGDLHGMAWYSANSDSNTHAVGTKMANGWGLRDMHGNVWEWCADWYGGYPKGAVTDPTGSNSDSVRVIRGGSWYDVGAYCRSANRSRYSPARRNFIIGFRVAAVPAEP